MYAVVPIRLLPAMAIVAGSTAAFAQSESLYRRLEIPISGSEVGIQDSNFSMKVELFISELGVISGTSIYAKTGGVWHSCQKRCYPEGQPTKDQVCFVNIGCPGTSPGGGVLSIPGIIELTTSAIPKDGTDTNEVNVEVSVSLLNSPQTATVLSEKLSIPTLQKIEE